MPESPLAVAERLTDQNVTLLLKDGRTLEGKLLGLDEHMNLVLDDGSEKAADVSRHLGRIVVRGSNVVSIHAPAGARPKTR